MPVSTELTLDPSREAACDVEEPNLRSGVLGLLVEVFVLNLDAPGRLIDRLDSGRFWFKNVSF